MRYLAKAALSAALAIWLAPALAATTLTATPATGHPSVAVTVTGAGYGDSEPVDVYFDTVDSALGVTSATGALSVSLTIPASTQPGTHYITAIGRKSGDAVQKIFVVATAWIESGFGAGRLAWNSYENTLSTSVVSSLELQWAAPCAYCWGAPAVVNGYAFVGAASGGGFFGFNAATGAVKWSADVGTDFYGAPAFANNVVYAEDVSGVVHAYTAGTGKEQWTKSVGNYSYQPLMFSGGVLYAPGQQGIFTFSASGSPGWSFSASGQVSGVAVGNGLVFFTSGDGILHALNATTGVTAWTYTMASGLASSPAVANGVVYVGDYQGNFYALRAKTGLLVWQAGKAPGTIWGTSAVANGIVYVEDASGDFYAYQAANGELLWTATLGSGGSGIGAGPAVADGVVYATAGGITTALDAQYGQILVGLAGGNGSQGVPVIANGMLYITNTDGNLYAYAPNGAGADAIRRAVTAPALSSLHPDLSLVPQQ
jgi:outer membrane protein assembly factor BamB